VRKLRGKARRLIVPVAITVVTIVTAAVTVTTTAATIAGCDHDDGPKVDAAIDTPLI